MGPLAPDTGAARRWRQSAGRHRPLQSWPNGHRPDGSALQSAASRHVLVITADYAASAYCRHEMEQAIKCDPGFTDSKVLPILQDGTPLPPELAGAGGLGSDPLCVNLCDDKNEFEWALLLKSLSLTSRRRRSAQLAPRARPDQDPP